MSYNIAAPDEYLAITGMRVKTIKITKAAFVFPFQRCMRFSVQPHDYAMNLQAMTKEKLQVSIEKPGIRSQFHGPAPREPYKVAVANLFSSSCRSSLQLAPTSTSAEPMPALTPRTAARTMLKAGRIEATP